MLAVIVVCMCVVITVDCDGDIEEHFRRSLGRDYCNYLSHSSGDCTVRQSSAQWNGAVACSSAAAAPCSSAVTSSGSAVSRTTLSDLLSTDAEICDSTCDASKKCSAISITGLCVCVCVCACAWKGTLPVSAHSLQETVLPKPVAPIQSRDSEGVPFASVESL